MSETIQKQSYKQTEVGLIPKDWSVDLLENLTDVIDPHPSHRAPAEKNFGVPFLGIGDFNERGDIISRSQRIVGDNVFSEHQKRYDLNENLIGLGRVASIGKVVSLRNDIGEYTISPTLGVIRSKSIDVNYLKYILKSIYIKNYFTKIMSGSTRSSVGMIVLRKIPIPFPTLTEQRAIATALSDIDELLTSLEQLISKKQAIKQGAMQELLTPPNQGGKRLPGFSGEWEEKKLGGLALIDMGQSPLSGNYNLSGNGLPLVQGNADIQKRKTIVRNYTSQITKTANKGDIIMSVRAPVGEIATARFKCCIGRGVCSIKYQNDFLYYYLIYIEHSWSKFSTGSTFDNINSNQLRGINVSLPESLKEQKAIAQVLSDMDEEIKALEGKKVKYQKIKEGIMQELLTGKIRLV